MNCLDVRDVLAEFSVGVLEPDGRADVERHLEWCAGCRKEAAELGQGAAVLAVSLEPAALPRGLDDRVVQRVGRAAGAGSTPRRMRTAAAWIIAAMVAVASLGWGAVMAGRADRFEARAEVAERERAAALRRFEELVVKIIPGQELPTDQSHFGELRATAGGPAVGQVFQLVSPGHDDITLVVVEGLDPSDADAFPYRVELSDRMGVVLKVGQILELDADGSAEVFHQFRHRDLTGFTTVRVLNAADEVVLIGTVDQAG